MNKYLCTHINVWMCINCSFTVIRFSPQLAWPVYRLIKSDRRIMTQTNTHTPLYPPPYTHTKAGIEKTSSTAKQIHKNVCMCVSVCMFVATTSINKNCLYSFSLPLSLSLLRSLYMFSPFKRCTRPKTGSIAWFSVCTICGASQHSGIFPSFSSPPLRSRFWCMLCVRFFVFSLAQHVFATTWPLLTVGRRRYEGALRQTSRVLRFSRMPQAHPSMFQLRHWPNCCPIDDVIADADRGVCRRHIQRLFLAALGFFPALHLHN